MQEFTGTEYLKIDIANNYGLDKEVWEKRIAWVDEHMDGLEELMASANKPYLYIKAVMALRDTFNGIPSGHLMGLDCTASGAQLYAVLSGCHTTAGNVNLINTGKREDVYLKVAETMSDLLGEYVDRSEVKKPVMTSLYNSKAQPESVFGEGTEALEKFHETLATELTGAIECMHDITSCWDSRGLAHTWTLPDGHVAHVKVEESQQKKITVDELAGMSFEYRTTVNTPSSYSASLAPNIIQSFDAYVVREVIRKCAMEGVQVLTVHDAYFTHPNNMNLVRFHFRETLADMADNNYLQDVLREITGTKLQYVKISNDLGKHVRKAEYFLS